MFENARAFSTHPEATFTMAPMRIVRLTSCRPTIAQCEVRHNREGVYMVGAMVDEFWLEGFDRCPFSVQIHPVLAGTSRVV
jgi:hypothetical protein